MMEFVLLACDKSLDLECELEREYSPNNAT